MKQVIKTVAAVVMVAASISNAAAGSGYAQTIGNTTFYSSGVTAQTIGNTTFYSNGVRATTIGNTTFYSK